MILVLLANGFEEIEALTPVDMLRRANLSVKTVGVENKTVTGSHNISVVCDMTADEVDFDEVEMIILPGGMPGTLNLDASPFTNAAIEAMLDRGGRIAAICAAPLILGKRRLLVGKNATCYPEFEDNLIGANLVDTGVVTDGNITTARGMGVAIEFAEELISQLLGKAKADEIASAICKNSNNTKPKNENKYTLPKTDLLKKYEQTNDDFSDQVLYCAKTINNIISENNIRAKVNDAVCGPRIITINIIPESNQSVNEILKLSDDICLELAVGPIRVVAPIPGKSEISVEIPLIKGEIVGLRSLIESDEFKNAKSKTTVALGRDAYGNPVIEDIAKMPHILIGGATGMGKSILIDSIINSILYKATPDEVKLILIDPKQVEFYNYKSIPHLLHPIVTDPKRAAAVLKWAADEVDRRFTMLQEASVRNIDAYNEKAALSPESGKQMEKIVIIIDELADLMLQAKKLVEQQILFIAQKARAAGIYLILATQRPTTDVINGLIKANIPSRICLRVMSSVDSQTVLDIKGGEKLLDRGDALYSRLGSAYPIRIQSAYISDSDIVNVTDSIISSNHSAAYDEKTIALIDEIELSLIETDSDRDDDDARLFDPDDYFDEAPSQNPDLDFIVAVEFAIQNGKISASLMQRTFSIGYSKACKFLERMEKMGIITPMDGNKPRTVLITMAEWLKMIGKV